jgi:isopentenyl diphosphate isomerase/L-lactate dehydrogenase-like FMN-dependent dehydrogenase
MSTIPDPHRSRRAFLQFLLSSPLFAFAGSLGAALQDDFIISKPDEAINVLEFEAAARKALPAAHWGYLASGVDDEVTLRANRDGFSHYQLRPRQLVDVSRIDMSIDLLGTKWETPIVLAPCGTIFHPEGANAVARAARTRKTLQILASGQETKRSIEGVMKARGGPVWYQLYSSEDFNATLQTVKRVESAGTPVLVWTVDVLPGRNLETTQRLRRLDTRQCTSCHATEPRSGRPGGEIRRNSLTWDALRRLREATKMKVLVKGILTAEDAELCVQYGADGIVVSNHGGRAAEAGRAAVDCLPEVAQAVRGRVPVLVDGGFRRGTDVFKAIALGARAICIGRPYQWGVSAFGEAGVESVLSILQNEFQLVMAQCGTRSIAEIGTSSIVNRGGRV